MPIYFMRHGQTIINRQSRLQGFIDAPLSAQGYRQAFFVGKWINDVKCCNQIYTSDLSRAFETAKIISAINNIPVIPTRLLRERDLFEFELLKYRDLSNLSEHDAKAQTVNWDWCNYMTPDIVFVNRMRYLLSGLDTNANPLLVSHAGFITTYVKSVIQFTGHIHIPTGSVVEFLPDKKEFNLIVWEATNENPSVTKIQ